jgi:hypothetical protein
MNHEAERRGRAGCIYLAKSRRTGALRGVYNAQEQALEESGWATVCEDHGTLVISETRALALASDTDEFCDECRAARRPGGRERLDAADVDVAREGVSRGASATVPALTLP